MKATPELSSLRNLLFIFDIDYMYDEQREEKTVSKNVNDEGELTELFNEVLKPEFIKYPKIARDRFIQTLEYYLNKEESFDPVFEKLSTYFDDDIEDQRHFMQTLLKCLINYEADISNQT